LQDPERLEKRASHGNSYGSFLTSGDGQKDNEMFVMVFNETNENNGQVSASTKESNNGHAPSSLIADNSANNNNTSNNNSNNNNINTNNSNNTPVMGPAKAPSSVCASAFEKMMKKQSRYVSDFEEIAVLGKGSFGEVTKVR
jgi:hypothetical protein